MTADPTIRRRRALQLLAGGVAGIGVAPFALVRAGAGQGPGVIGDATFSLRVDSKLRTQILSRSPVRTQALTGFDPSESLRLASDRDVALFRLTGFSDAPVDDVHGRGVRHTLTGVSAEGVEKTLWITVYERYPGTATLAASYRNLGVAPLAVAGWTTAAHVLRGAHGDPDAGFWSFSGASYEDRRDWVQPVKAGFQQRNFMGMNASDYGGGTPVVDVWRRNGGLCVGHLERRPQLVSLPILAVPQGVRTAVETDRSIILAPGETVETIESFLHVHSGDYFASLDTFRRLMADEGLSARRAPESAYGPIWCAWGYERNFTTAEVEGTLGKARELGLEWAVLDDGWQTSEGDWYIDRAKFPRGEDDMIAFAAHVKAAGLKPRLWFSPLSVSPGTDLLHDHVDMLLLDKNGAVQNVSWWNAFYLCPAYQPTVDYTVALVEKIIGKWGYAGLKLDGQHLNGVAPCYNPAHRHARPEESIEKLQDFWQAIYAAATRIDPEAVVELCPCGTSFAFHNIGGMNQTPASDPESSWQVRLKGKTLKALMGSAASFAGDHVELSDHGDDFASSVGIGAVVSTKFTWPADTPRPTAPQPKGGYVLTPEKEILWRKWVAIYRDKMLPKGHYLGALYDIGFDKPEAHVIERSGRLYYAFYAAHWDGPLELRGLGDGQYSVSDYVRGASLGTVSARAHRLSAAFDGYLLLEATPVITQRT
jgi:alpha-galactosidase